MSLNSFLTSIANAIRNKKGTTEPINASNFASEIESIEVGGAGVSVFEGTTDENTEVVIPIHKNYYYGAFVGNAVREE